MNKAKADPFQRAREGSGVLRCEYQGEAIPLLLRYRDVKEAAQDWERFSSDAPFRVPIPSEETVRRVRQLPIETNPPDHGDYRKIVEPFFRRPSRPEFQERLTALIDELLAAAVSMGEIEVVTAFSLPLQSRALACLLNVDDSEADEWIGWGVNVLRDKELSHEKGMQLDRYIERRLKRAETSGNGEDLFSALHQAEFRGRPLTDEEKAGFCNLVFAGGRDTVIHSVSFVLSYLARNPAALKALAEQPRLAVSATEEFMRVVSPLTHIGRVCPAHTDVAGETVEPGDRVGICWASANYDASVFDAPGEVQLDRKPNPHLAFGTRPHTCLGALHARVLVRTLLERLVENKISLEWVRAEEHLEVASAYSRVLGFEELILRFYEERS